MLHTIKNANYFVNSLQCSNLTCTRWVHYACTNILSYHLQNIIHKPPKARKWLCINCTKVTPELQATVINKNPNDIKEKLRRDLIACEKITYAQRETINDQEKTIRMLTRALESINANIKEMESRIEELILEKMSNSLNQED